MVKISLILDKRYRFKDDTYLIKIKIFRNHEAMYIPTGIKVQEHEWNKDAKKIVQRRDKSVLNLRLTDIYSSIFHKMQELQDKGKLKIITNKKLYNYLVDNSDDKNKELFKTQYAAYLDNISTKRTKEIYQSTYKHISMFCDIETLSLNEINIQWLDDFVKYLTKEGCKAVNTRSIHLRNIRAIINHAKKTGVINKYVFDNYKIEREETIKRSLTIDETRKLLHADLSERESMYRDIFFLIIFLMGINLVDLSLLKEIKNGRISYRRAKTGTLYNIKVEQEALEIIEKYKGKHHLLYIFDRYKNYNDFKRRFNENLKKICHKIGIEENISTYWARHTFATLMYEIGIPMDTIADCLGHKSYHNKITLVYVKKSTEKIDAANRKLIDYIFQ